VCRLRIPTVGSKIKNRHGLESGLRRKPNMRARIWTQFRAGNAFVNASATFC